MSSKGSNPLDYLDPAYFLHDSPSDSLAKEQWEWQKAKYDENFEFQKGAYEYQKALNDLAMEREDNAVQRRVADLKEAGLSPTLAAGSAASATSVHAGTAPQYEVGENPRVAQAMFKEQMQKDRIALALTAMGNVADVSQTFAQKKFIEAKTGEQDIINKYLEEFLAGRNLGQDLDNDSKVLANGLAEVLNPLKADEMRGRIDVMKSQLDVMKSQLVGIGYDNELKHNETLRKVQEDAKRELENELLRKNIKLSELRAENIDFDTALKAYTLTYAVKHNIPLTGLNDWQVIYNIMGEVKNWFTKDDPMNPKPTPNPFNTDEWKDDNGHLDFMKLLQLIGS